MTPKVGTVCRRKMSQNRSEYWKKKCCKALIPACFDDPFDESLSEVLRQKGPEHHSFLLRMSVRKGHAAFVCAAAWLSQLLLLPFPPLSQYHSESI